MLYPYYIVHLHFWGQFLTEFMTSSLSSPVIIAPGGDICSLVN